MNILLICALYGGGRERRCAQLLNGLDGNPEFDIRIISVSPNIEYVKADHWKDKISILDSRYKKTIYKSYKKIISEFHPDIIHLWLDEPRYVLPLLWYKCQFGYKLIIGSLADGNYVGKLSKSNFANQLSYLGADAIVSNTRFALKQKHAPAKKSHVIYNGFDFARIPDNIDKEKKREELGISTKYVCMMCARFMPGKDYDSFIKVAELAQSKHIDITFLAVGQGPQLENKKLIAQQRGVGNIIFLGRRNDVEELLQICEVSMLLSVNAVHQEGVSNAIMESLASGVPVIATDGGGSPEIIRSGVNGYLTPSQDYDRSFAYLTGLLFNGDVRKRFSDAAKETVIKGFLLAKMVDKYIKLYESLTKSK